ncbi:MAG: hypothetical protein FJW69_03225 [Actinobacteria bacterium]|nr:hypothetical protein [Actinomycetota bacterium]
MINNIEENIFNTAINEFNKDKETLLEIGNGGKEKIVNGFRFVKFVKFRYQKKELQYYVEIKANINNTILALLQYRKETLPHPFLLITRYINNNKAEELKKNGIQFIDTAGNAYINYYPIYIFIKGNKPLDLFLKNTTYHLFEPSGLKIIYALLINTNLVKQPYRFIAETANVALGTVGATINDLIKLGFIIAMGKKGRKLLKSEELFKRWCIEYNEKLKQKLLINKFTGPENWWINYKLNPECAQWGGDVAANKLTKYLKPQDIIIYSDREKYQNIVIENRLRKDINGNIIFFERFWKFNINIERKEIVNPILIFADLINTGNQRALDTARIIYEEYINRHFRKN